MFSTPRCISCNNATTCMRLRAIHDLERITCRTPHDDAHRLQALLCCCIDTSITHAQYFEQKQLKGLMNLRRTSLTSSNLYRFVFSYHYNSTFLTP